MTVNDDGRVFWSADRTMNPFQVVDEIKRQIKRHERRIEALRCALGPVEDHAMAQACKEIER